MTITKTIILDHLQTLRTYDIIQYSTQFSQNFSTYSIKIRESAERHMWLHQIITLNV